MGASMASKSLASLALGGVVFPGPQYGHITSNIAESLNASLLKAREKPILGMFEHIHQHLMSWYAERCQIDSVVPPNQIVVSTVVKTIQELTNYLASMTLSLSFNH